MWPGPRRSQALLVAAGAAILALSAISDLRVLGGAADALRSRGFE